MPRFMRSYGFSDRSMSSKDGFEELFSLERSIDRRLTIFLVVFAFVVVGALASGSASISSAAFSIGSVICWLIAISLILTTRKAGAVASEIKREDSSSYAQLERRLYSKLIRWILGYIIPVFCAVVLTFGSVASSLGWLNNVWFYKYKVESKVDEIKNNLPEIESKKPETEIVKPNEHFKPIDSVMTAPPIKNKALEKQVTIPNMNLKPADSLAKSSAGKNSKPQVKKQPPNKHFQPIDKVAK